MPWRPGQSGGGYPPRQCNETLLEDAPRAYARCHKPDGVERVLVLCGAVAQWMLRCPLCNHAKRSVFEVAGRWACRTCHRLDYTSRHSWIGGRFKAAQRLRQRLGGLPSSLAPLPPRPLTPRAARRYDRIVARIHRLEGVGGLDNARVIRGLERVLEEHRDG